MNYSLNLSRAKSPQSTHIPLIGFDRRQQNKKNDVKHKKEIER